MTPAFKKRVRAAARKAGWGKGRQPYSGRIKGGEWEWDITSWSGLRADSLDIIYALAARLLGVKGK